MQTTIQNPILSRRSIPEITRELTGNGRLIIASNRGPLEYYVEDEILKVRRGSGGVVTAVSAISDYVPTTWVAAAMSEGDRIVSAQSTINNGESLKSADSQIRVNFVVPSETAYEKYYNVFSNPLLWFIQHEMAGLFDKSRTQEEMIWAWVKGYLPVNRAFAARIMQEISQSKASIVMLHDYHLYLVAKLLRDWRPSLRLQHFVHIPWPQPHYWQVLPKELRTSLISGLCANDIVGFQTYRSTHNFLTSCKAFLPEARVDFDAQTVCIDGHFMRAKAYPISIDNDQVRKTAGSLKTSNYVRKLSALCGHKTIVRVDRVDPSKNIVRGFEAFDKLFKQHPELIGEIKFLCFLVPSRTEIPEYASYVNTVLNTIDSINERYGNAEWRPIEYFYENNYEQALAALQLYDVLLVNPIQDGMNLVVKEGALINQQDGVILLSKQAGAFEQLAAGVIPIDPLNVSATATALFDALMMSEDKKKALASMARTIVAAQGLDNWLLHQLTDLTALAAPWARAVYSNNHYGFKTAAFSKM
jgi:trehalose 6-phosphate synthase